MAFQCRADRKTMTSPAGTCSVRPVAESGRATGSTLPPYSEIRRGNGSRRNQMADWGNGRLNFQPRINTECALEPGKSGRGLPQSKTWRKFRAGRRTRSVLDCASPLALWNAAMSIPDAAGATGRAAIRWTCRLRGCPHPQPLRQTWPRGIFCMRTGRFTRCGRGERELSQLAACGRWLTWRIAGRLVCADALRLGLLAFPGQA